MSTPRRFALAALCALLAPAALAQAPAPAEAAPEPAVRSSTTKLFVQGHFNGVGLAVEGGDAEAGSGMGLKVGYGLTRLLTLYAGFDFAAMTTRDPVLEASTEDGGYGYGLFDVGAQLNFRSGPHQVVPYVDLALTGQAAVFDVDHSTLSLSGAGLTAGGGVKYFVTPTVAVDGGLAATFGSFTRVEYRGERADVDDRTTGVRLTLGVSWYPLR